MQMENSSLKRKSMSDFDPDAESTILPPDGISARTSLASLSASTDLVEEPQSPLAPADAALGVTNSVSDSDAVGPRSAAVTGGAVVSTAPPPFSAGFADFGWPPLFSPSAGLGTFSPVALDDYLGGGPGMSSASPSGVIAAMSGLDPEFSFERAMKPAMGVDESDAASPDPVVERRSFSSSSPSSSSTQSSWGQDDRRRRHDSSVDGGVEDVDDDERLFDDFCDGKPEVGPALDVLGCTEAWRRLKRHPRFSGCDRSVTFVFLYISGWVGERLT
jgi:hypothetical protein